MTLETGSFSTALMKFLASVSNCEALDILHPFVMVFW